MTCCGTCDHKTEDDDLLRMRWGAQGFKIREDKTFWVPAPDQFAGWKANYGPGCECGGGCGGSCGGTCGGSCGTAAASDLPGGLTVGPGETPEVSEALMSAHPGWSSDSAASVAATSDLPTTTTTTDNTTTTTADVGGVCPVRELVVEGATPKCCMQMWCAPLQYIGFIADHCWIEVTDCYNNVDRYEVWQDEVRNGRTTPGGNKTERIGKHTAKNLNDPGVGVGGGDARKVCDEVCVDCEPDWNPDSMCGGDGEMRWVGCDCADAAARSYPDKDTYWRLGPNSNTFAQAMADACGMDCELPRSAIGRDYVSGVNLGLHGCNVRAEALGVGVEVGLSGATVSFLGLPIGISSQGLHCIFTIPIPW